MKFIECSTEICKIVDKDYHNPVINLEKVLHFSKEKYRFTFAIEFHSDDRAKTSWHFNTIEERDINYRKLIVTIGTIELKYDI